MVIKLNLCVQKISMCVLSIVSQICLVLQNNCDTACENTLKINGFLLFIQFVSGNYFGLS